MLKQLLPCSSSTIVQSLDIYTPSQSSQLSSCIPSRLEPESTNKHSQKKQDFSNVIILAQLTVENRIEINQQALQLMTAYSKWQVGFCGVFSMSIKRHRIINKIFEIPALNNKQYNSLHTHRKIITMSKLPFSLSNSKKVFFVQYSRPCEGTQVHQGQEQLIKLLVSLCSSLLLCIENSKCLGLVSKLLVNISKMLGIDNTSQLWPHACYLLNNNQLDPQHLKMISSLFNRTLSLNYQLPQSQIFQQLLIDLDRNYTKKYYEKLLINVPILCKALICLTSSPHTRRPRQHLKLPSIFSQHIRQIYEQSYNYLTELYDQTAQKYLIQQKAYKIDYILDIFSQVKAQVLAQFQVNLSPSIEEEYLIKLQDYIDQKQRLILEVNKKKNKHILKQEIEKITINKKQISSEQGISNILRKIIILAEEYDHSPTETVSIFLLKLAYYLQKYLKKLIKKSNQPTSHQQDIKQLLQVLCNKQYQLEISQQQRQSVLSSNKSKEKQYQRLKQRRKKLKETMIGLQKQIQIFRGREDTTNSKRALEKRSQKMLEIIRELQERYRENQENLRGVRSQIDFNPDIDRMERRISDIIRQCENLEAKKEIIESYLSATNIHDYTFNQQ